MQFPSSSCAEVNVITGQVFVVVSEKGDFVVAPDGPGRFEDSSCIDAPCAPVVFDTRCRAEKVALSMCVDSNGFVSSWRAKAVPPGCATEGLAVLMLDDFAQEAARLYEVFGLDVRQTVAA